MNVMILLGIWFAGSLVLKSECVGRAARLTDRPGNLTLESLAQLSRSTPVCRPNAIPPENRSAFW